MDYENRTIPEGINVSHEHPLKEFAILSIGLGVATIAFIAALSLAAGWLVHFIPFEKELQLADSALFSIVDDGTEADEDEQRVQLYLQELADKLAIAQNLPEEMIITVHYQDSDTINAFATLGGHIVIFRGLLEKLPHENALAMVMAHEIAHIKHRDPLVAAGRGITVGLALTTLAGFGDSALSQQLLGQVGLVTSMGFSREQERDADQAALATLGRHYGHSHGAEVLFEILAADHNEFAPPALLSTHPVSEDRIAAVKRYPASQSENFEFIDLPTDLLKTKAADTDQQRADLSEDTLP